MPLLTFHFQIKTILFLLGLALFDNIQDFLYMKLNGIENFQVIAFILIYLSSIGINCFSGIIIQSFNPIYLTIGDSLGVVLVWIVSFILNFFATRELIVLIYAILELIPFFLILLSSFIYTELIILDCFGLKYYTKDEIMKRAEKEISNTNGLLCLPDIEQNNESVEEDNYE